MRADLLAPLGRKKEAVVLWQQVESENPGTPAATVAAQRLEAIHQQEAPAEAQTQTRTRAQAAVVATPLAPTDEEVIYSLASRQRYREVVAAIDQLEARSGKLSWDMEMQRMYSLHALTGKERARAIVQGEKLARQNTNSVELAMFRSDLLVGARRWEEASAVLKDVKASHPDTPVAKEAQRRLEALPAMCNLDKQNWGEMYVSGDYHSRYTDVIGSGFIRDGTYVPHARWLQPYVGMRFSVDTESDTGPGQTGQNGQTTIVQDNAVSFFGGVRAQVFPMEYLFLYAECGYDRDLLDQRHGGDWAWDYQAGIYGFKSYGPGVVLKGLSEANAAASSEKMRCPLSEPMWRGDWFVDAGANFSYYHRYNSWLGYAQTHEGFRLVQFGRSMAFDAYLVENVAWDAKGNYYDNLFEIGPGVRLIWEPKPRWQVGLRTEWVEGFYFGRDDLNSRGSAESQYDDFRISLSVGGTW